MTATTEALFDLATPRHTPDPPRPTHTHRPRPRRDPDHRAAPCNPTCILCGRLEHPDGLNYCRPACLHLCAHTEEASLADVCLITVRATAHLVTSPYTGKQHAVVTCPHCGKTHRHTPAPGRRYRISGCRKPYIVQADTPENTQ